MIFYFSGTGNTRWAAEEISRATGERLLDMAAEINGECRYQPAAGECIGFCFPVHGWRWMATAATGALVHQQDLYGNTSERATVLLGTVYGGR